MRWITLGIAGYAAVVATVDLILRVWERRKAGASLDSLSTHWWFRPDGPDKIEIEIHNLSPEPIRIEEYGWFSEGVKLPSPRGPKSSCGPSGGDSYVLEIAARDGGRIEGGSRQLDSDVKPDRQLISWIRLTTGEEFTSPPIRIRPTVRSPCGPVGRNAARREFGVPQRRLVTTGEVRDP